MVRTREKRLSDLDVVNSSGKEPRTCVADCGCTDPRDEVVTECRPRRRQKAAKRWPCGLVKVSAV
eukprot:12925519-Prorocentrum_lima.AAC.1